MKITAQLKTTAQRVLRLLLAASALNVCAEEKPNIIYILADDLGYGDLGAYGQAVIQTPNLDQLAAEGMRFTQHYAGSSVCAPSRSCLLTGKHTGHTWVRSNGEVQLRPDPEDPTIATVLKQAGYRTAMIGKSGTGGYTTIGHANEKGFDYFFGFHNHKAAHRYFPPEVYRNSEVVKFPGNAGKSGDTYIHDEFFKEVMGYLEEHKDGPFFLHYATLLPHSDLAVPEEWVDQYRGKVKEQPLRNPKIDSEKQATFAGMVSRLDWEVGEIMKKLKELGIDRNTVVMFSSDNGPHSEGGNKAAWFDSNGPLRGEKRDFYEGGVRVPMIARWPGRIPARTTTNHLSAFWDVMPTLSDLTGAACPEDTDGISFLPTLLGKNGQKEHDYLYWEFYEQGGKRAARKGNWKAVQLNMDKGGNPIELYDLESDLGETTNLAAQHPELVSQFEKIFAKAHTPSPLISWENSGSNQKKK